MPWKVDFSALGKSNSSKKELPSLFSAQPFFLTGEIILSANAMSILQAAKSKHFTEICELLEHNVYELQRTCRFFIYYV